MAIEIMPRVGIQPVRSQTGGVDGRVVPMRDATGAQLQQIGEGMQDLGRATTALADQHQDNVDLAMSQRMRNLFDADHEKELRDPQAGFLTTLGMDASEARWKQSSERLRGQRTKIEKMAQNEAQRRNFAEFADRIDADSNASANVHRVREAKTWRAGETKASADRSIERAIQLSGTDEGEIAAMEATRDIDTLADLYGWPKDSKLRENLQREGRDALHGGVIDQMLASGRTSDARSYLESRGGEMSVGVATRASKMVRTVTVAEDGSKAVNVAVASSLDGMAGSMAKQGRTTPSEFDMLALFDDASQRIESADLPFEVKESAQDRLRGYRSEMLQKNAQSAVAALNESVKWIGENPNKSLAALQQERPDIYTAIADSGDLPRLQAVHEKQQDQLAYGEASQISDDELRKLSEPELTRRFWGRLSATDMGTLAARHRVANGKATGKDKKVVSDEDRITEAFHEASMLPRNKALDDAGKRRLYLFKTRVQSKLDGLGDIDDKRFQGVLDEAVMDKALIDDWGGDTPSNVSTMLPEEQPQAYVEVGGEPVYLTGAGQSGRVVVPTVGQAAGDRILPSEREKIVAALTRDGQQVTEQAIAAMWMAKNATKPGQAAPVTPPGYIPINPMTNMSQQQRRLLGLDK